jgi:hypothetical protein
MRKILFVFILFLLANTGKVFAQDTLPKISIKAISNKVIVSWRNEYQKPVTVIDIQRSTDSLRNFSTIGIILNPLDEDNGFVDTKPLRGKSYYRVFIAFEGGDYVFSRSYSRPRNDAGSIDELDIPVETKSPVKTPYSHTTTTKTASKKDNDIADVAPIVVAKRTKEDVIMIQEDLVKLKRLPKTTVIINVVNTKSIRIAVINNLSLIRHRLAIDICRDSRDLKRMRINIRRDSTDLIARLPFTPSKFINIGKDNDVIINLPLFAAKKYSIKFYAEKDSAVLFEINKITEPYLILEKVNFKHSGWFRYHLYSNNILVEKYKIYIAIDNKSVPIVKEKVDLSKDK